MKAKINFFLVTVSMLKGDFKYNNNFNFCDQSLASRNFGTD